jgi:hypothetical protein
MRCSEELHEFPTDMHVENPATVFSIAEILAVKPHNSLLAVDRDVATVAIKKWKVFCWDSNDQHGLVLLDFGS